MKKNWFSFFIFFIFFSLFFLEKKGRTKKKYLCTKKKKKAKKKKCQKKKKKKKKKKEKKRKIKKVPHMPSTTILDLEAEKRTMNLVNEQRKLAMKLIQLVGSSVTHARRPCHRYCSYKRFLPLAAIDEHARQITEPAIADEVALLFQGGVERVGSLGSRRWQRSRLNGKKRPHRTLLRFVLRETGHPCRGIRGGYLLDEAKVF